MKKLIPLLLAVLFALMPALGEEDVLLTPEWPAQRFPGVPPIPDTSYRTELHTDTAVVYLDNGADDGYESYGALLIQNGFDLFVTTGVASVYSCGDTDVVLMRDPEEPFIRLLNEPDCGWGTDEYLPPLFARYVSAVEDDGRTTVTIRGAAPDKVIGYFDDLIAAGWKKEELFLAGDCTAYGVYTKKNRKITVDYYSLGFDFTVTLEKEGN